MEKLLLLVSVGSVVLGPLAIAACVGDEPSSPTMGIAQGELGGACFANGTCNAGLSCNLVDGTAKCAASTGSPSSDASSGDPTPNPDPDGTPDSGGSTPAVCKFQPTPFPCGDQMPPNVCYGATQSCTATGCGGGDLIWECNSSNQCGTACCVSTAAATLTVGEGCAEGSLLISAGAGLGASCASATACEPGATQLCQANSGCPKGQRCVPIKVIGPVAALSGTILGACAP